MAASDDKTVAQLYGLNPNYTGSTDFLCGVEYEIEGIRKFKENGWDHERLMLTDDPSLRNNGREIVTYPFGYDEQLDLFDVVHKKAIEFQDGIDPYSDRTSTHVHVNFKPIVMREVQQFVRLYVLFEPYFFSLVKPERMNNIYCVPLNYTFLPTHYSTNITYQVQRWHKYTAFNLKPLEEKGTIEFRHLQGTGDKEVFVKWLSTIKALYDFNRDTQVSFEKVLRTEEGVKELFIAIFGQVPVSFDIFDDTIIDTKMSLQKYTKAGLTTRSRKLDKDAA